MLTILQHKEYVMLGREICFGCRKPKRRADWHCAKCHKVILRNITASEKRLKAKRAAST
jgi:hypothetical protein